MNYNITNILGSIDKKIEINKKKIEKLEAIARGIYDYWFVQYEFPDENGKPYKSNGGQLVWNGELKREVPVGWQVSTIGSCVKKVSTGLNPRTHFVLNQNKENRYITVKNLTEDGTIDFSDCDFVSNEAMALIHKRSDIKKGDILFASIAPLGRAYYIAETPKNWDINESVFSIRPDINKISSYFLFMYLRQNTTKQAMELSSFGSIFKGIRIAIIKDMQMLLPSKNILEKFDKEVSSLFTQRNNIDNELQKLCKLKEYLLPLLMNGQVVVH